MIDTDKYEGHSTEYSYEIVSIDDDKEMDATYALLNDAPLLLVEVKRLRKQLAYDSKVYHEMCEEGIMAWNNAECRLAGEEEMFGEVD